MGLDRSAKQSKTNLWVKLSLATFVSLFPASAVAQNLNCFENLIFGEITPCGAAGTVTVNPDNSTSSSCVTVGGVPQSRGRCSVTQSFPYRPIQVNVSAAATISNGTTNMNITSFNIVTNAGGTQTTQTAPFVDVPIGATLNIGASQASGSYSGSLGVTAVFQ